MKVAKMMRNDNTGTFFYNDGYREGSKFPKYRGEATIDGKVKKISIWVHESTSGREFFTMQFTNPGEKYAKKLLRTRPKNTDGIRPASRIAEGVKKDDTRKIIELTDDEVPF